MSRQPQNPISFKTVPGRNKTQKWQQAKTYNYDGDDWGGYDPYDEYGGGGYEEDLPPPQPPVPQGQYGQAQPAPAGRALRRPSFDTGDEKRQFSAGPVMYGGRGTDQYTQGMVGGDARPRSRPRDFTNPEQVPLPLHTRASPAPAPAPVSSATFPPRKSSISADGNSPPPDAGPLPASTNITSNEKQLPTIPFIRPSDIYKRMAEEKERERQSMESTTRPTVEGLLRDTESPAGSMTSQPRPLSPVVETPAVPPDFGEPRTGLLPQIQPVSSFRTDFMASAGASPTTQFRSAPGTEESSFSHDAEAARRATQSGSAAEALVQGTHEAPVDEIGRKPSQGYRSMVNQAFVASNDASHPSTSLSRDGSQSLSSGDGVSRSDTASTSGISPIMSRVPSTATTQIRRQDRDVQVPTIAEEVPQRSSFESHIVRRKASPATTPDHSRNSSTEVVKPGFRRSLDPPSADNSPARSPGLENASSRRLSEGLIAETGETNAEPPDVPDQGVEMMPSLHIADEKVVAEDDAVLTQAQEQRPVGRPRAGTDYSLREADLAETVNNSSNEKAFSPVLAEVQRGEQDAFLEQHTGTPTAATFPGTGSPSFAARTATVGTGNGRSSPGKGRVREIADRYHDIHQASRRNSFNSTGSTKSSWSNFRGSDENLPATLRKQGTGAPVLDAAHQNTKPGLEGEQSFRPQLPGQWVSYADTPAEATSPATEDQHIIAEAATPEVDFAPTAKSRSSPDQQLSAKSGSAFMQAKSAGAAMGEELFAKFGMGHQTRDFGSTVPAAPVEDPGVQQRTRTGETGYWNAPSRPEISRGDTGATDTSVASGSSSVAPTPPVKDTRNPAGAFLASVKDEEHRPPGNYFADVVPPLQPKHAQGTAEAGGVSPPRLGPLINLSTVTTPQDTENDRLREEIVRSLSPETSQAFGTPQTQATPAEFDHGRSTGTSRETLPTLLGATTAAGLSKPLIDQRFSWENRPDDRGALDSSPIATKTGYVAPRIQEPEYVPEILPEMPYERPRSRGLHIVNAEDRSSSEGERDVPDSSASPRLGDGGFGPVSPLTKSQDDLHALGGLHDRVSEGPLQEQALSPVPMSPDSDGDSFDDVRETEGPQNQAVSDAREEEHRSAPPSETPEAASKDSHGTTSPVSPIRKQKIPPFREILAVKNPTQRIAMYDDTRRTFADMDTGLSDWLSAMLTQSPEHANLSTSQSGFQAPAFGGTIKGHKHSPSLARFKSQFTSSTGTAEQGRRTSFGMGSGGADGPPRPPPKDSSGVGNVDMDKLQQRGKDLMKNAGVLGGKAQAGAKGLLAKGKSRFGTRRESGGPSSASGGANKDVSSHFLEPPPTLGHSSAFARSSFFGPPQSSARMAAERSAPASGAASPAVPSPAYSPVHNGLLTSRPQTPSSFTRTLTRLRDRSRSSRGSRSRPVSLMLGRPDNFPIKDPEESIRNDAASFAVAGAEDLNAPNRHISPWPEPEDYSRPPHTPPRKESIGRLGILPSPTVDSSDGVSDGSPRSLEQVAKFQPPHDLYEQLQREWGGDDDLPKSSTNGPQHQFQIRPAGERRVSDLALLPSQRGVEAGSDAYQNLEAAVLLPQVSLDSQDSTPNLCKVRRATKDLEHVHETDADTSKTTESKDASRRSINSLPAPADGESKVDLDTTIRESAIADASRAQELPRTINVTGQPFHGISGDGGVFAGAEAAATRSWERESAVSLPNDTTTEDMDRLHQAVPSVSGSKRSSVSSLGHLKEIQPSRVSPIDTPDLTAPMQQQVTGMPIMSSHAVPAATGGRGKRISGFFRRLSGPILTTSSIPGSGRDATSGDFGPQSLQLELRTDGPTSRRRSGIWDTFRRAGGNSKIVRRDDDSAIADAQGSADATVARNMAEVFVEPSLRPASRKQPQRAVSAAAITTESRSKQQRFSRLGSVFGRTATTGHGAEKSRKLTKMPQVDTRALQKQRVPNNVLSGYDAYEAGMQGPQRTVSWSIPPPLTSSRARTGTGREELIDGAHAVDPPPGGWYAPQPDESYQKSLRSRQPEQQQFRHLFSASKAEYQDVPEAFRPVERSYGRQAMPIGPPVDVQSSQPVLRLGGRGIAAQPSSRSRPSHFGSEHPTYSSEALQNLGHADHFSTMHSMSSQRSRQFNHLQLGSNGSADREINLVEGMQDEFGQTVRSEYAQSDQVGVHARPAVSRAVPEMRGSSYPDQDWAPPQWI